MLLEKMRDFVEFQQDEPEETEEPTSMPMAAYSVVAYEGRETEFLLYLFEQVLEDTKDLTEEIQ